MKKRTDITLSHDIARRLCKTAGVSFGAVLIGYKRRTKRQMWTNEGYAMFPTQPPRIWFHLLSGEVERITGGVKRLGDKDLMALFKGDPENKIPKERK